MASAGSLYERIEDDALRLPHEERSKLIGRLIESLDDDDDLSAEWADEIRRRVREIDEGEAKLVPHDEVMSEVRTRLAGERRKP